MAENEFDQGSVWHRWEPHVHAPGTLLNDQFKGENSWDEYLRALEESSPKIRALAVTDYYLTDTYEAVLAEKEKGRLPDVELIFPNVEMRLDVGTIKGRWVNIHLLVSPEDPEHLTELKRFLELLQFRAHDDVFSCKREDLIRLGKKTDPSITDDVAALRVGANQFKVSFDQIRKEYSDVEWVQQNILIAVAGSKTDGTSGVRDSADATLREEMEKFAHVIFASSAAQRDFWIGLKSASVEQLRERYDGVKPCLHGCDAHSHDDVAAPDEDRYSWVKGGLEFDALRQACINPAGRAYVGDAPPEFGTPSQSISKIEMTNAPWMQTPNVAFNPGLVAVIGARGSGKTALADIVALACDAMPEAREENSLRPSSSFIRRAGDLLGDAQVQLYWRSGDPVDRVLYETSDDGFSFPRARYLSQQFVEDLCSASGVTDSLMQEIERVIFESHPLSERDGALNFQELLELRASRYRQARLREEESLVELSDRISIELEKIRVLPELNAQVQQKKKKIGGYRKDLASLVAKGSEERVKRLAELTDAAEKVRSFVRFFNNQKQSLLALQDEVADLRTNKAPEALRLAQERYKATRMKPEEWKPFRIDYSGDVDTQLEGMLTKAREQIQAWKGEAPKHSDDPERPYIDDKADLEKLALAVLEAEIERLQKLVSGDEQTAKQFTVISKRIAEENTALEELEHRLEDCKGAKNRVRERLKEREAAYERVFDAITSEQKVLDGLYKPLEKKLSESSATVQKLSFTVSRSADVKSWATTAEDELVDLRRQGPFKGRGSFQALAEEAFKDAWEAGAASDVSEAMRKFQELYRDDLLAHSKVPKANHADFRAWSTRFAKWLFSTQHISLHYGVEYDGVDIRKLSPGTRGVVLLLLYLALDETDDRPLIIDQPEENLDPKSVYDELVGLFIEARERRQVIMVTHNANLVVNTDADQIIIAEAGHHQSGSLPPITYTSGGLESAAIRNAVCEILEGGEPAFKERARRLRVQLER